MDAESEAVGEGADVAEAVRRHVPVANGRGLVRPRPAAPGGAGVSRVEFQAAMARVGDQIKRNADGVMAVNAKTAALLTAMMKGTAARKKQSELPIKDINSTLQMLALLPLLVKPPTIDLNPAASADGQAHTVSAPDNSPLDEILPLLLVRGMGGSAGGFSLGGGGSDAGGSSDNGTMMMVILALALSGGFGGGK